MRCSGWSTGALGGAWLALAVACGGGPAPARGPEARDGSGVASSEATAACVAARDTCYTVEELGPVHFEGFDQQALGINARGTVAFSRFADGVRSAYLLEKGVMRPLGDLGGGFSDARAVNAWGYAVGGSRTEAGAYRAASYYRGKVTDLGTLDGSSSWAQDVNDWGLAVGSASVAGTNHAAAFFAGRAFDLGILGGETYANGVNAWGDVVGTGRLADGTWRGFLLRRGAKAMQDLGTIGGVPGTSTAWKVSDAGTVCGSADAPNAYHGFLYRHGEMVELGDLGSSVIFGYSFCRDVNEHGVAVGTADDIDFWDRAVVWTDPPEGLVDLNTRISPDLGIYLFWASNINSRGQITCHGFNWVNDRGVEGYLLTPVRCPAQ